MRLRNVKNAREKLEASKYFVKEPEKNKGNWSNGSKIHLEIGTGKGDFLIGMATTYPDILFIGVEKYESVLVRAIEKAEDLNLSNLKFICYDAAKIDNIFDLLKKYIETDLAEFNEKNIKLIVSGDLSKLPFDLQKSLLKSIETTKNNTKMVVNMCLNYGGRQEILYACNKALKMGLDNIDEQTFKSLLYTKDLPELDFVIRTSGEERISNFMLFDLAYAELYFTKTLWPDFGKVALIKALKEFCKRERRFGKA